MKTNQERRSGHRILCAELVEVIWRNPAGRVLRHVANLEDISAGGLCLQLETHVPVGTPISIRHSAQTLDGVVAYSLFREGATFAGIAIDENCRAALQRFKPGHLLDVRDLVDSVLVRRGLKKVSAGT